MNMSNMKPAMAKFSFLFQVLFKLGKMCDRELNSTSSSTMFAWKQNPVQYKRT